MVADVCLILLLSQLVSGMTYPTQQSKILATLTGACIGVAWWFRHMLRSGDYADKDDFDGALTTDLLMETHVLSAESNSR
jgi:hypothetical protein